MPLLQALLDGEVQTVGEDVPSGWRGLDSGPGSAAEFADIVADAGTVFWNGPMGMFEDARFAAGLVLQPASRATYSSSRERNSSLPPMN